MQTEVLFEVLTDIRSRTLKIVQDIPESKWNVIPTGFRNHVRWHLGHILVSQEKMLFLLNDEPSSIPEGFSEYFAGGTDPSKWESQEGLPEGKLILQLLKEQPKRIKKTFADKLQQPMVHPFTSATGITYNTVEEMLHFSLYHEGIHAGILMAMKKIV